MSKKIFVIAGLLLGAGTVAALSAPHFRGGGPMRGGFDGPAFGERGGGLFGPSADRYGERLKELDANKDGMITLEEYLSRRAPNFTRLDKNKDGSIDRAEFEAVAKENADYWVKRFIKRFDADGDGRISKEEFTKAARERLAMRDLDGDGQWGREGPRERFRRWMGDRGKDGPDGKDVGKEAGKGTDDPDKGANERRPFDFKRLFSRADRRFDRLDKNGDGFIDAKDLEPVASERAALASKRFFQRFDADGDGKVTKEEFDRFAKARFASHDIDGDGKITDADLPPMMRGRGFLK